MTVNLQLLYLQTLPWHSVPSIIIYDILNIKVDSIGITGPPLLLLCDYLRDRYQVVSICNAYSKPKYTNLGVTQGSILGPLIFLIYNNDLPNCLTFSKCKLYADDTTIINSNEDLSVVLTQVNSDLHNLLGWCKTNRLTINPCKTKFLQFSSQNKSPLCIPPIFIDNHALPTSEQCVYLSVNIDRLKFQNHVTHFEKKLSQGRCILIKARPFFSRPVLLSLYFAFVHSHINYCITSWGDTYATDLKPLQIIQNQAI